MDNVELGVELKRIRKDELRLTQLELVERSKPQIEIKKLSRLECGYQLPDHDYFEALEGLNYDTTDIRKVTDDVKKRQQILRRQNASPATQSLAKDIEQIKVAVGNNNKILREVLKTVKEMQKQGTITPAQEDLFSQALQPVEF